MTPDIYIDSVIKIKKQKRVYREINQKIQEIESNRDFPTYIKPIDSVLEGSFVAVLDDALFSLTGFKDMASYHLYECTSHGRIKAIDGNEYYWQTDQEYKDAVLKMIIDKNSAN